VENIRRAYRAGVKLATGTDFWGGIKAFKHGDNALEIVLFVEKVGMSPMEALRSATIIAAEVAGLENVVGSLKPGKYADIVLVDGNPLDNPRILLDKERIVMVIKEGRIVKNILAKE
jgi:imidazolonepropionase-like amidohydrolase